MWRTVHAFSKRGSPRILQHRHESFKSSSGSGGKVIVGSIVAAGVGFGGLVVYGKYDPSIKKKLEDNIPYMKQVYDLLPGEKEAEKKPEKDIVRRSKSEDTSLSGSLLKKKIEREKEKTSEITSVPSPPIVEPKPISRLPVQSKVQENVLNQTLEKLKKSSDEAVKAQKNAADAVVNHTTKLFEAVDLSEGNDGDVVWTGAKEATLKKDKALKIAKDTSTQTKLIIQKVKEDIRALENRDPNHPLIKTGQKSILDSLAELQKAESGVTAAETEAKRASEYENLVKDSKDQFRRELKIVLPSYIGDDKAMSDGDLNLLLAHAHRRIEQLQKQMAKHKVTEKSRIDQAVYSQKLEDERLIESLVEEEIKRRNINLESAVENRVKSLKANLEKELHQQLLRQAAAHSDHLKEALKVSEQEMDRKHMLELEEKLLHQKGVFISEISGNMSRVKGILDYLKAKSEFDKSSKKAQALWLTCQALNDKITIEKFGNRTTPLAVDIASIKIAAEDENDFIFPVLQTIPNEVIEKGVYTTETLKNRFLKVRKVCERVALIDENNDSLYRYLLSYLQSFLIINAGKDIPVAEKEGKVAVDPKEWDTYDILRRVSLSLAENNLEQALRYANQLKGEPRAVAKDWMYEVRLLLETQLAVKALLAHAAAVGVQAYH